MKKLCLYIPMIFMALAAFMAGACSDNDKTKSLDLDGDCRVTAITIAAADGIIDHEKYTIDVRLPQNADLSDLKVDAITLSSGAVCDFPAGTRFNAMTPRAIHVVNGDAYSDYILRVSHIDVEFLTFTVNGRYEASIDNQSRTITAFVPLDTDVTAMQVSFTVSEGAVVTPESGALVDFSSPVEFKAIVGDTEFVYTASVIRDDMSQAPKAFIGNAASPEQLGQEAATAYRWMLENVPNTSFVSIQSVIDGSARLDDYSMIWCHFDWTDWPGALWDSRDMFNSYWIHGGNILASRDGARYINDVWRIAKDQQSPNNMFGGESFEMLDEPLGFGIEGHESHPLYNGIDTDGNGRILLVGAGCTNSGRTLQWGADWDPYFSMEGWESRTGAKALAQDHNKDINRVTIAEFEPYEALKGFTSGRVITIGTPAYEWFRTPAVENPYSGNIEKLTRNAINYLCQ